MRFDEYLIMMLPFVVRVSPDYNDYDNKSERTFSKMEEGGYKVNGLFGNILLRIFNCDLYRIV